MASPEATLVLNGPATAANEILPHEIERKLIPQIRRADHLADSYDFKSKTVTIRPVGGLPLGLNIVSTKKDDRNGVYIAGIVPGSPSSLTDSTILVRGMRILSLNNVDDLRNATKDELTFRLRQCSQTSAFILEVAYDPHGFKAIDGGEELRRITMYAFHHHWSGSPQIVARNAMYLGYSVISEFTADEVKIHAKRLMKSQKSRKDEETPLELALYSSIIIGRAMPDLRFDEKQIATTHMLIDTEVVTTFGRVVVIISNDSDTRHVERTYHCHGYLCDNRKAAVAMSSRLNDRCKQGKADVEQALAGNLYPITLIHARDLDNADGDEFGIGDKDNSENDNTRSNWIPRSRTDDIVGNDVDETTQYAYVSNH